MTTVILIVFVFFWLWRRKLKIDNKKAEKKEKLLQKSSNVVKPVVETTVHKDVVASGQQTPIRLAEGITIGELITLRWLDGKTVDRKIPVIFVMQYDINPTQIKRKFAKKNYIEPATLDKRLNALKVTDLKNILKSHNLKLSGRKAELIQRIIENVSDQELDEVLPIAYELSPIGRELIQKYNLLLWAEKNDRLTPLKEYVQHIHDQGTPESIAIQIISARLKTLISKREDAPLYAQYEKLLASFSYEIEMFQEYTNHVVSSALLDYFLIGDCVSQHGFIYLIEPADYNTKYLQSYIIKNYEEGLLDQSAIENGVSFFVQQYNGVMQPWVKLNRSLLIKTITSAISEDPDEYHRKRIALLKQHLTFERLT